MRRAALILSLLVPAVPSMAGTISLQMPVDCMLGQTCYIQNYVDRDPGPGARDVGCGALTYDGHKGTDFALPTVAAMTRGVAVLAAAPGRVTAIRDGEPDRAFVDGASVAGKECGNGIVVDLGDGWETQYCHMRDGSVAVKPGDTVRAGEKLGLIGQSGQAEFPHLHLSLRHDGKVVDPFDPDATQSCDAAGTQNELWSTPIAYTGAGLLAVGLAARPPKYDDLRMALPTPKTLPADGPALVAWAYGFGAQKDDIIEISFDGPDGTHFEHTALFRTAQALYMRYAGKKTPQGGWPVGDYTATVTLMRKGALVTERKFDIKIAR